MKFTPVSGRQFHQFFQLELMKREDENEINITRLIDDLKYITKIFDNPLKEDTITKGYVLDDWIHLLDILIIIPEKAWREKE